MTCCVSEITSFTSRAEPESTCLPVRQPFLGDFYRRSISICPVLSGMGKMQICSGHGKVPDNPPHNATDERYVDFLHSLKRYSLVETIGDGAGGKSTPETHRKRGIPLRVRIWMRASRGRNGRSNPSSQRSYVSAIRLSSAVAKSSPKRLAFVRFGLLDSRDRLDDHFLPRTAFYDRMESDSPAGGIGTVRQRMDHRSEVSNTYDKSFLKN